MLHDPVDPLVLELRAALKTWRAALNNVRAQRRQQQLQYYKEWLGANPSECLWMSCILAVILQVVLSATIEIMPEMTVGHRSFP